jgi:hypothetical protein
VTRTSSLQFAYLDFLIHGSIILVLFTDSLATFYTYLGYRSNELEKPDVGASIYISPYRQLKRASFAPRKGSSLCSIFSALEVLQVKIATEDVI